MRLSTSYLHLEGDTSIFQGEYCWRLQMVRRLREGTAARSAIIKLCTFQVIWRSASINNTLTLKNVNYHYRARAKNLGLSTPVKKIALPSAKRWGGGHPNCQKFNRKHWNIKLRTFEAIWRSTCESYTHGAQMLSPGFWQLCHNPSWTRYPSAYSFVKYVGFCKLLQYLATSAHSKGT